jgi:hypothetical protein
MNTTEPSRPPLTGCPQCGCRELFIRKDFPQKLGLAIVALAAVAFLVLAAWRSTFYIGVWILIAAAAIDLVMYFFVPKITVCYKCRAEFRNSPINPNHHGYELAVGEKYRVHDR